MENESDRKNFTLNNCKIFNSTLILNYLEMKSLLLSLDDDDDDNDAQVEIQNGTISNLKSNCFNYFNLFYLIIFLFP